MILAMRFFRNVLMVLLSTVAMLDLVPEVWGQAVDPVKVVDPAIWTKPTQPPLMRELLKGAQYQSEFDTAMKAINKRIKDETSPVSWRPSLEVVSVDHNSPASELNILPYQRLLTLNGKTLWHRQAKLPWNDKGNQLIELLTIDGKVRIISTTKKNALEGAALRNKWDQLAWVLARQNRDPRWDEEMLVGISQVFTNPNLAESAWFHAIRKGYKPDTITWWCGAHIAARQHRHKELFDFAAFVPADVSSMPDPVPFEADSLQRSLWAIGHYRMTYFCDLQPDLYAFNRSPQFVDRLQELQKIHNDRPEKIRLLPTPSERAAAFKKVDIVDMLVPTDNPPRKDIVKGVQMRNTILYPVKTGNYIRLLCGINGPLKRAEFNVQFTLNITDNDASQYAKCLKIGLVENGRIDGEPVTFTIQHASGPHAILEVGLGSDISGPPFMWIDPAIIMDGKTMHTVRIIRFDGQVELFFNGTRLAYLPVDDRIEKTDFMIHAQGVTATIRKAEMFEFLEKDKQDKNPSVPKP